ncbi:hypothetical protein ILUMI_12172 [Ignelater luminosus]|uniref:ABC transporter domain-containing protein n=1 Tax=Ignelater luminosus TaxID=2038154 RepID=A0A8K0CZ41_IGNLU|nr:hypothetical protein ILUMI_12172 [Ignelater luminosus]
MESETTSKGTVLSEVWPRYGEISFDHVYLRYCETEAPVLTNINLSIKAGEKIGIVGRTGAGKSSLICAIFHLASFEGCIKIDGINTKDVGLNDLRRRISIIPQDPVLFSATLRSNLDPFNEYSDEAIWKALEEAKLKDITITLDYFVQEGGNNFSVGQRQLLCLARAILRNNKILILDEATANVDPKTDDVIQKTVRNKFKKCTVLTIAHRLHTIMDSDKVLVMDAGNAAEYDHPHLLLQNPNGYLYNMVKQTGPLMAAQLHSVARHSYLQAVLEEENSSL